MADGFAIGKALEIPDNVLKNIEQIDKKINDISKDSEIMAQKFNSAMIRMGNGSDVLLKKLQAIQGIIGNLGNVNVGGLSNMSNGMSKTASEAERLVKGITDATVRLNEFNKFWEKSNGKPQVLKSFEILTNKEQLNLLKEARLQADELSRQLTQMNKQSVADSKAATNAIKEQAQIEKNRHTQKMATLKQEESSTKIVSAAYRDYVSAISMSEQTENSRLKKIERMNTVLSELRKEESKYASEVDVLNRKIASLTKENEKLARAREQVSKQQKTQKIETAAINAYNRAMASSEALVSQRINKIAKLRQAEEMLVKTGKDYSTNITKIRSEIERLNKLNQGQVDAYGRIIKSQSNLMNTSDQLMRKLALIFSVSQIQSYLIRLANVRAEFELQNTALASLLNNKDKADKLFAQITELAVKSPFTVKELVTYTKSLSAYQVEYEKLYDTTKMLADVSAGLGVDMQRLILAFGQVKAANFLRGTETRQFAEAGFNILGELAKYYTELEGRIVSLGEVQDRQFKRMITFADVEEVFKRATSEGGLFFEMQERQAETLFGMMSNLNDSIDLMFNSIGQSKEGILKGIVSTIRTLVENWQIFANILQASIAGFITYASKVTIASLANGSFTKSTIAATVAQGGISAAIAKTIKAFQGMAAFAKANPFVMIASAVTFAGYQIYDHYKKVEKNKESYDSLVRSLSKAKSELKGMLSSIEEQNKAVKSTNAEVEKYNEGTNEYYEAEAKANKEREKMSKLLADISKSYPEIAEGLKLQEDGTLNVVEAQKRLNEELERSTYLTYLSRQTEGFWDDGLQTNISKATAAQLEFKKAQRDVESGWTQMNVKLKEYFATNKYANKELKKQLDDIANSSLSTGQKISKMYLLAESTSGVNIGDLRDIIYEYTDEARKSISATTDLDNVFKDLGKDIEYVANEFKAAYDVTTEEGKAKATEATEAFLRLLDIKDEAVRKFVETQFEIKIGVSLDLEATADKQFSIMEDRLNKYLEDRKFTLIPEVKEGQGLTDYFKRLNDSYKDIVAEIEKIKNTTQQLYPDQTNQQRLDELNAKLIQTKTTLKDWGELVETKDKDTTLQTFKEQLSFLEKVNKKYEKLQKNYNDEEAKLRVINALKEEAKQKGVESIFMSAEFDDRGTLASMEKVKAMYKNMSQEMKIAFAEAFGGIQLQLDIDVQENRVKEIQNQFSDLFGNYELSLELDNLGLDKNLASQLFGVEVFDLAELRKQLEPFKKELQTTLGKDGISAWEEMDKKISEMEAKELQERLKTYSQYLKQSVSERVKIEMEAQKKIAEVQATEEFTPKQKERITYQIKEERDKALDKQAWADFQDSELYIKMFEDLEFASTKALDAMETKLIQIRGSLKNLSPTELKEINNQLEKIQEIKVERNPFSGLVDNIKEYRSYLKEAGSLNEKFLKSQEQEDFLKSQKDIQDKIVATAREEYAQAVKKNGEYSKEAQVAKINLNTQEDLLDTTLKQLVAQGKITQEIANQIRNGERLGSTLNKQINNIGSIGNTVVGSIGEITGMLENFGVEFSESFKGVLSGIGQAFQGLEQIDLTKPMSIVTGAVSVFAGIGNAIASLFGGGDDRKEKEIQRQIELVEQLEKSYEKLEKAIDNAYSIDTLKGSTDQAIANLEAQNEALQKAIAAEKDKKKTDDDRVKDFEQQYEDNLERIEELNKQFIEGLGGFGSEANIKSAAQEFADAWLEAYLETGDGLDALSEKWDEYIQNVIAKQLMLRGTEKYLQPVMDMLDGMLEDGLFTSSEAKDIQDKIDKIMPQLNEFWKSIAEGFDLDKTEQGDTMSGLSKSITGITEQQADALAAITESIRFFVSDSNTVLKQIYNAIVLPNVENPFLMEMKLQTEQLRIMSNLWSSLSMTKPGVNGKCLRVNIV